MTLIDIGGKLLMDKYKSKLPPKKSPRLCKEEYNKYDHIKYLKP